MTIYLLICEFILYITLLGFRIKKRLWSWGIVPPRELISVLQIFFSGCLQLYDYLCRTLKIRRKIDSG